MWRLVASPYIWNISGNNGRGSWLHLCRHMPGKMCTWIDTIFITHRRVRRSTAGPKRSDLEIGDANNAGSYIVMTENDKSPRWRAGCALCSSVFASIIVVVMVYRNDRVSVWQRQLSLSLSFIDFFAVILPKRFEFRYPTPSRISYHMYEYSKHYASRVKK